MQLKIELAIAIDAGEPFVRATYNFEGDGPIALHAYEEVRKLYNVIALPHYPNLIAIAKQCSNGNLVMENQMITYAALCTAWV